MTIDALVTVTLSICGAITAMAGAWKVIKGQLTKPFDDINKKLDRIQQRLDDNDDATASVMLEKLMWSYRHYCIDQNPIPLDVRTALEVMYEQYKKGGRHNHVPGDYLERLRAVPVA